MIKATGTTWIYLSSVEAEKIMEEIVYLAIIRNTPQEDYLLFWALQPR